MIKHGNAKGVETAYAKIPFFDFLNWLDYFIRVCPLLVAASFRNTIVVTDRYVYDVIADLHDAGSASHRIVAWLLKLFPRPTVVFYIKVPPELAYVRKDDIPSLEFLYRIDDKKQALLKELPPDRVIMLDGTRPVQELAQSAFQIATALMT